METYAIITSGDHYFQTKSFRNSGRVSCWNEVFEFPLTSESVIYFALLDKGTVADALIGNGQFDLGVICGGIVNKFCDCLILEHKGRTIGELYVNITFYENPWYEQQVEGQILQAQQHLNCNHSIM